MERIDGNSSIKEFKTNSAKKPEGFAPARVPTKMVEDFKNLRPTGAAAEEHEGMPTTIKRFKKILKK